MGAEVPLDAGLTVEKPYSADELRDLHKWALDWAKHTSRRQPERLPAGQLAVIFLRLAVTVEEMKRKFDFP